MAITVDELLERKNPGRIKPAVPGIDIDTAGAPATIPGSGQSGQSEQNARGAGMTGTPVAVAGIPPAVSDELPGMAPSPVQAGDRVSPKSGEPVYNPSVPATVEEPENGKADVEAPRLSYTEMFERMSPYRPSTKEQLEKEHRKRKREAIFSAIGEGLSALSNLYYTNRYAPDSFDPSKGMAATTKARFDRMRKEQQDNRQLYMNGYMHAMNLDANNGYKEQLAALKEREQSRKDAANNISIQLKQADLDLKNAKVRGQDYINELNRLKGEAQAKGMDAQVALVEEKIKTEKARQARLYRDGRGGAESQYPWYDRDGNKHYARSYEAMRQNAIDNGTWMDSTQESVSRKTSTNSLGMIKGTSEVRKSQPAKGHSIPPAPAGPPVPEDHRVAKQEKVTVDWE